jgi:hypothetical protein
LVAVTLPGLLMASVSAGAETLWLTDYDAARAAARRGGKPIFVVFRCEH